MFEPIVLQYHEYVVGDWWMTPIDFGVTMSKVKVTVTLNAKPFFYAINGEHIHLKIQVGRYIASDQWLTHIGFGVTLYFK